MDTANDEKISFMTHCNLRRTGKIVKASRYQNDKDNYYLAKVKNKSYIMDYKLYYIF